MNSWLDSKKLARETGKSMSTVKRIIKTHAQQHPDCVRKVIPTGKKSRPYFEILWNTTTNQPATQAEADHEASTRTTMVLVRQRQGAISEGNARLQEHHQAVRDGETFGVNAQGFGDIPGELQGSESGNARLSEFAGSHCRAQDAIGQSGDSHRETITTTLGDTYESSQDRTRTETTEIYLGYAEAETRFTDLSQVEKCYSESGATHATRALAHPTSPGENHEYAHADTYAQSVRLAEQTESMATSVYGVARHYGRSGVELQYASPGAVVDSLPRLSYDGSTTTRESGLPGEGQAGDGSQNPNRQVCEVIELPVRDVVQHVSTGDDLTDDECQRLLAGERLAPEKFDELLERYLLNKKPESAKSLRYRYRKQYTETGEIPSVLLVGDMDGRKRSGRTSTLSDAIKLRIERMIIDKCDKASPYFMTKRLRKLNKLCEVLENELEHKVPLYKIASFLKSRPDLKAMLAMEDTERNTDKTPSAFPKIPVGNIITMDGVEADYFKLVGGELIKKPLKPIWIELYDTGSRKLMAMHAYSSESNENSADIFNRFLRGNTFVRQTMHIRPDNAKGFLNLKPVLHELNQHCKATMGGFAFIDDYARPLKPKDKAHLESSHRAFHHFESHIIAHYQQLGRVVGKQPATRRVGNKVVDITITLIDVTLEEFNASGLTQRYIDYHNNNRHRFTEDGLQKVWIPAQRWDDHITQWMETHDGECLVFGDEESRLVKIHGCRKHDASIQKDGSITFQKQKYAVPADAVTTGIWSRHASTPVKVGRLSDNTLAIFTNKEDGKFLCEATVIMGAIKPQHIVEKEKAKLEKIHENSERAQIIDQCAAHGLHFQSVFAVDTLMTQGLTLAIAQYLLANQTPPERYSKGNEKVCQKLFISDLKNYLITHKTIKPYATGEHA